MKKIVRPQLFWLLITAAIITGLLMPVAAQQTLSQTYTSADGALTFDYPEGWLVSEEMGLGVVVADTQYALEMLGAGTAEMPPDVFVMLMLTSIMDLPGIPMGLTSDSTPMEVATLLGEDLVIDFSGEGSTVSPAVPLAINDRRAARMDAVGTEEGVELMLLVFDTGQTTSAILAVGSLGYVEQYKDTVLQIAETVRVSIVEPPTAEPPLEGVVNRISYDESHSAVIAVPQGDRWVFTGEAGEAISIRMTGDFDTYLELYDDEDILLTYDDDSGGNLTSYISGFTLPASGDYTIVAKSLYEATGDSYTLTLRRFVIRPAGSIIIGENVKSALEDPEGDYWTFEGKAGDVLSISMVSSFDNYLELFDADNNQLAYNDDSGGSTNARIVYTLSTEGTFTILARALGSGVGEYTLSIERLSINERGPLPYGAIIRANLTSPLGDYWTLTGEAGDIVTIIMVGNFDTFLELLDSQGNLLISNDSGIGFSDSLISEFALPASGEYTVIARGYSYETGNYLLVVGNPHQPAQ